MRFRATVQLGGKTATGIQVPAEVVDGLGSTKRPAVRATIRNHTYRTSVAPMGGVYMLPVSAEVRQAAGVAAGDEVDVVLELDTEPREVAVPADLQAALDADESASRCYAGLSYSARQRVVLPIEAAKAAETRQRRIEKAIAMLREGRA